MSLWYEFRNSMKIAFFKAVTAIIRCSHEGVHRKRGTTIVYWTLRKATLFVCVYMRRTEGKHNCLKHTTDICKQRREMSLVSICPSMTHLFNVNMWTLRYFLWRASIQQKHLAVYTNYYLRCFFLSCLGMPYVINDKSVTLLEKITLRIYLYPV